MSPRPTAAAAHLRAVPRVPEVLPEGGERRRDPRREISLFAHLITAGGRRDQLVLVRDLSASGVRLRVLRPSHLGLEDTVGAQLLLPRGDRPEPLRLGLRIVRIAEVSDAHIDIGCTFEAPGADSVARLAAL